MSKFASYYNVPDRPVIAHKCGDDDYIIWNWANTRPMSSWEHVSAKFVEEAKAEWQKALAAEKWANAVKASFGY